MRPLIVLMAILVALPFALAQGQGPPDPEGGPGGGPGGRPDGAGNGTKGQMAQECRGDEAPRQCVQEYCDEHPDDRQCQRIEGTDCARADCAELSRACQAAQQGDDRGRRACVALERLDDIRGDAHHVEFELDREGRRILNYTVGGTLLLRSITYGDGSQEFEVDRHGQRIRFESGDARLEIHDSPTGDFWFRGDDATLLLTFPENVSITPSPHGHLAAYGDRTAILAGQDVQVAGAEVSAHEAFRFFSPPGTGPSGEADKLADAAAKGHLGARVGVSDADADVTAYDEVDVNLTRLDNGTYSILVDAELDSGRTIAIDIAPGQLRKEGLELRYYDVHGENLTRVYFRQAAGLDDILDPNDDAGQPEYWVVEDDDGLHVLVSVPHWSAHVIELASLGEFIVQPSVLLGAAAGVVGVAIAGTAMFWPRRRDAPDF